MLRDLQKLLPFNEDIDKKIHEYQATLKGVTTELQKLDDALNSITKHLQDMSKHPTYGKYAYLGLEEIQKYMLDNDDDEEKNRPQGNLPQASAGPVYDFKDQNSCRLEEQDVINLA